MFIIGIKRSMHLFLELCSGHHDKEEWKVDNSLKNGNFSDE